MKKQETNKIQELYKQLYSKYGNPEGQWKLWCKKSKTLLEREEVIIGAILAQRANWKNVDLAIDRLKQSKMCSLRNIYDFGKTNKNELAQLVRPSGFYQQKANYLFEISKFFIQNYKGVKEAIAAPTDKLRKELLAQKGIGPETADDILLYALDKPVFVIDEYTRRFVKKHNLTQDLFYAHLQELFQKNLPQDIKVYRDFHAMIVLEGKDMNLNT